MIKDRWIICLASEDWGGHPSSSQHLIKVFARYNKILWIDSIGMRRPEVSSKDMKRIWSKLGKFFRGLKQESENFYVYTPVVLPFHEVAVCRLFNRLFLQYKIKTFIKKLKITDPVWWVSTPIMASFIKGWEEGDSIYYMGDEYAAFYPSYADLINETEKRVLEKIKMTLVISDTLYDKKKDSGKHVFLIGHGVDVEHFAKATAPETELPADLADLPRPICGYFGLIKEHVDLDLLEYLARQRPEWSFVIIGSLLVEVEHLRKHRNLRFIGPRPYSELPAYLKAFNVGMIPPRITDFTLNANPLKMREYLAAGKPIVSPPLPAMKPYLSLIETASTPQEFLEKLEFCLSEPVQNGYRPRQERMARESWGALAEKISGLAADSFKEFKAKQEPRKPLFSKKK